MLLCYLKGLSGWYGILDVLAPGGDLDDDGLVEERRRLYPVRVPIGRRVTLPSHKAVSMFEPEVWAALSATKGQAFRSVGWINAAGWRSDLADIERDDGLYLARAIASRSEKPLTVDEADDGEGPVDDVDARERIERSVVMRRGQRAFREKLMVAYGARCAISGCAVRDVLEAAHVTPYLGERTNRATNGLLLRADLHTLWDCGLLAADPVTRIVLLSPALAGSEYAGFAGRPLANPQAGQPGLAGGSCRRTWTVRSGAREPSTGAAAPRSRNSSLATERITMMSPTLGRGGGGELRWLAAWTLRMEESHVFPVRLGRNITALTTRLLFARSITSSSRTEGLSPSGRTKRV